MRQRRPIIYSVLLLSLLTTGCAITRGYYEWGHVPAKAGKYPRFSSRDTLIGKAGPDRSCYDVNWYDISITLNPSEKTITGKTDILFTTVSNTRVIRIDLYPELMIDQVTFDSKPIAFSRRDRAVYLNPEQIILTGEKHVISVSYHGKPMEAKRPPWEGGTVWSKDIKEQHWLGVAVQSEGPSTWFPCKDHISDEADSVRIRITVPKGLNAVSNGMLTEKKSNDLTETFTWVTRYPINTYNITYYAGRFRDFSDEAPTKYGSIKCNYSVLPENYGLAKVHFKQVRDVLRFFSDAFGPYPWPEEGFRLVEAPYEGMEHQTAIAYGKGYENYDWLGGDYIIVHEAAHEWWGNAVTVSDFSDIWLQEGLATYSEVVFVERKLGYKASLDYILSFVGPLVNNKRPVVGPRDVAYWDHNDNDVYHKGALIIHTIRNIIGDSTLFFDILQTFYRENALGKKVTTADFIEVVERKTGSEWDKFFETYLNRREIPVLKWYFGMYSPDETEATMKSSPVPFVCAKWINVPEGFVMQVTITCSDKQESVRINVSTKAELFFLDGQITCEYITCNGKYSYFLPETDLKILDELADQGSENIEQGNQLNL